MGDAARDLMSQDGARLAHRFAAGSHLEAMTAYNRYLGRGAYESAYPDQAARLIQRNGATCGRALASKPMTSSRTLPPA